MVQINDQVAALSKTQMDTAVKGAEVAVDALGKFTELQFETAKAAYAEGSRALRQIAAVKDPSQWASLPAGAAQPAWDKTSAFAKSAYDILADAQSEYAALLEQHVAEFNKSMVVALDAAAKAAPPGSESVMNAVKSAIHSTNTWYETAVKTARQMAASAEASVGSMTAQVTPARKKAA